MIVEARERAILSQRKAKRKETTWKEREALVNINLKPLFGASLELLTCMTVVCNPAAVRGQVVALSFPSCVHRCTSTVAPPCRPICLCALLVLCVVHNTLVREESMRARA